MRTKDLTDDGKAILLLCAHFGDRGKDTVTPLKLSEYNKIAEWLVQQELKPGDLLYEHGLKAIENGLVPIPPERLKRLLSRGAALGYDMEKWMNQGIWTVCRSDDEYPARIRTHLRQRAPAYFYCAGNPELLGGGGLAIVGSRNVDKEGETFTQRTAARCADAGIRIISGGARGVDRIAMQTALEHQGHSVGVLADSLSRENLSSRYRRYLAQGQLLLITPYYPAAKFNVGNAMGRNKLVYSLSNYALVISCEMGEGGTWAGAVEELSKAEHRPVFARTGNGIPDGNRALLTKGAWSFPEDFYTRHPGDALADAAIAEPVPPEEHQHNVTLALDEKDHPDGKTSPMKQNDTPRKPLSRDVRTSSRVEEPGIVPEIPSTTVQQPSTESQGQDFFDMIVPIILSYLDTERTAKQLAEKLDVRLAQMEDWLKKLCERKLVEKKMKPVRYIKSKQQGLEFGS